MFNSIEEAVKQIQKGNFVVVLDNENRENEGDIVTAAEFITGEKINFMISRCRGLICIPMDSKRLKKLKIRSMVENNNQNQADFTVSVDYKGGGTGISAQDRALTIKKLVDENSQPEDFIKPGHVFPLRARKGGILEREGHTEAVVDLMKLGNLKEAGVLCEILNDEGKAACRDELFEFAKENDFKIITIEDLKNYILKAR